MQSEENIQKLLDSLHRAKKAFEEIVVAKTLAYDALPEAVRNAVSDIENEFNPQIEQAEKIISKLEFVIKEQALNANISTKGEYLNVTVVQGRITWDNAKMEGYAAAHPDVMSLKTVGKPYAVISIRKDRKKNEPGSPSDA